MPSTSKNDLVMSIMYFFAFKQRKNMSKNNILGR